MEETIGYEAFFAPLEWQAILTNDWSLLDNEEVDWGTSSHSMSTTADEAGNLLPLGKTHAEYGNKDHPREHGATGDAVDERRSSRSY